MESKMDVNNNSKKDSKGNKSASLIPNQLPQRLVEDYKRAVRKFLKDADVSVLKSGIQSIDLADRIIPPSVEKWRNKAKQEGGNEIDSSKLEVQPLKSYEFKGYCYNVTVTHCDIYVCVKIDDRTFAYPMKANTSWTTLGPRDKNVEPEAIADFCQFLSYGYYVKFTAVYDKHGLYTAYYHPPNELNLEDQRWFVDRILTVKSSEPLTFMQFLDKKKVSYQREDDMTKDKLLFPCLDGACDCRGDLRILPKLARSKALMDECVNKKVLTENKSPKHSAFENFCLKHIDLATVCFLYLENKRHSNMWHKDQVANQISKTDHSSIIRELYNHFERGGFY